MGVLAVCDGGRGAGEGLSRSRGRIDMCLSFASDRVQREQMWTSGTSSERTERVATMS